MTVSPDQSQLSLEDQVRTLAQQIQERAQQSVGFDPTFVQLFNLATHSNAELNIVRQAVLRLAQNLGEANPRTLVVPSSRAVTAESAMTDADVAGNGHERARER